MGVTGGQKKLSKNLLVKKGKGITALSLREQCQLRTILLSGRANSDNRLGSER